MPFKVIPRNYHVWMDMKDRCRNPNNKQFADYGSRGISVCERWLKSYADFDADMGERPLNHTLDRIDNSLGYSPENCRWADRKTQQRNQRRAVFVMIEGTKYRAIELAETYGLKTDTIVDRAKKNMTFAEVTQKEKHWNLNGFALGGKASGASRQRTECPYGHPFEIGSFRVAVNGWKKCLICEDAAEKRAASAT